MDMTKTTAEQITDLIVAAVLRDEDEEMGLLFLAKAVAALDEQEQDDVERLSPERAEEAFRRAYLRAWPAGWDADGCPDWLIGACENGGRWLPATLVARVAAACARHDRACTTALQGALGVSP